MVVTLAAAIMYLEPFRPTFQSSHRAFSSPFSRKCERPGQEGLLRRRHHATTHHHQQQQQKNHLHYYYNSYYCSLVSHLGVLRNDRVGSATRPAHLQPQHESLFFWRNLPGVPWVPLPPSNCISSNIRNDKFSHPHFFYYHHGSPTTNTPLLLLLLFCFFPAR